MTLFTGQCAWFDERTRNEFLLRQAVGLGADWVLFLDCDEFIDAAALPAPLPELLDDVPDGMAAITAELVTYNPTALDDPDEIVVPLRLRHRAPAPSGVRKVFARAGVARAGAVVMAGNHGLELRGQPVPAPAYPSLFLGHYPMRSGWQMLAKATVGRLKVLASGAAETARGSSSHYTELIDHLIHRPDWVTGAAFLDGRVMPPDIGGGVIERPLRYLGGMLRYTQPADPKRAALRSVLAYAEALARSHGGLRDAHGPDAPGGDATIRQIL